MSKESNFCVSGSRVLTRRGFSVRVKSVARSNASRSVSSFCM